MSYYKSLLYPFTIDKQNSFMLEFSNKVVRFYAQHGTVIHNDNVYTVATPYKNSELYKDNIPLLRILQNGDILYLFHPNHPIMTLTRHGNTNWVLSYFDIKGGPWGNVSPVEATLSISALAGTIEITSSVDIFNENDVDRLIRLTVVDSQKTAWQAQKAVNANDINYSDNKYYKATASGTTGTYKPVHSEGTLSDGGVPWKYVHSGYATFEITEYVSSTKVKAVVVGEDEVPSELMSGTDYYEMGLIRKGAEYPICGAFFRNRFAFLINVDGIPHVCFSNSDDYNNFVDKEHGEVLSTNAVTIQVVSNKFNKGCWLSSASVLFVGTSTGEFYIDSASSGEAFAPDNAKIQQISAVGSLPITPVRVGSHTLFVTESGTSVRDIVYSYSTDTYDPIDISLLGKHLLTSGINCMTYQEYPNKVVWFTVNDGRLIGMTFMSEQNIQALHQHNLGGKVENIAIIPNSEHNLEDLWLVIDRDNFRSVEWLDNGSVIEFPNEINEILDTDKKEVAESKYMKDNAFYVDGGLTLERNVYKGLEGYVKAVSSNLLNKQTSWWDDNNIVSHRFTWTEENPNIFIETSYYKDNECSLGIGWDVDSSESADYELVFDSAFVGKRIEVVKFVRSGSSVTARQVYLGTLQSESFSFNRNDLTGRPYSITLTITDTVTDEDVPIYGLSHLEGKEVRVMIDGADKGKQTVTGGKVMINNKAKNVTVGLPIESIYIPQRMYIQGNTSSGVGDVQRIDHITFMFWRTMGGEVGQNFERLQTLYFRETDAKMSESAPLYTGNKTIAVDYNTSTIKEKGAQIVVRNDSVFPMNILAIAPHFSTSSNGL